jgi:hypothetical protein
MFLKLRKAIYLLLSVGSVGGAFLALLGLLIALPALYAGIASGSLHHTALGLLMVLACLAGATGPVWIVLTVIQLPDPPARERRLLSVLLLCAILAAGVVSASMLTGTLALNASIGLPIVAFVVPSLVGCALLAELWLPVWRARRRAPDAMPLG